MLLHMVIIIRSVVMIFLFFFFATGVVQDAEFYLENVFSFKAVIALFTVFFCVTCHTSINSLISEAVSLMLVCQAPIFISWSMIVTCQ